jgi:RNA polymerase sigma factor (sigma-70 family)
MTDKQDRWTRVNELFDKAVSLAGSDERKARILELHYFGGLTYEEMEQVLGVSTATLSRELRFAKAWLRARLAD